MTDEDSDQGMDSEEVDFTRGIQPHRYARLRSGYEYVVYLDRALWEHFGSAEHVVAALRALVTAAEHMKPVPTVDEQPEAH